MLQGRSCEYQAKTMCNSFLLLMSHFPFSKSFHQSMIVKDFSQTFLTNWTYCWIGATVLERNTRLFFSSAFSQSNLEREHTIPSVPDYLMGNFRGFPYGTKKRRRHWGSKGKLSLQRRKSEMNLINGKRY